MQIDNAGFHSGQKILLPENVSLLPQPAYSPATKPIERLWAWFKSALKQINYETFIRRYLRRFSLNFIQIPAVLSCGIKCRF